MLLRLHVVLDVPDRLAELSGAFWSAALGAPLGPPWRRQPESRSFLPPDGQPYVRQQRGEHGPRIHLDVETVDPPAETARLVGLGATAHRQALRSPGGFPFCLIDASSAPGYPAPLETGGGHRSRLVQVCIDSPGALHEREVAFWRAATEWAWVPSDGPEFAGKLFPGLGSPVHLLLQRLGEDDPGTRTRAHIDLGTDDVAAEVGRLRGLGAVPGEPGRGWVPLTDPTGLAFCVTRNRPD
jgi:hypothetical protein